MNSYQVLVWIAGNKDWQPVSEIVAGVIVHDPSEHLSFHQAYQRMLELIQLYPQYGYTVQPTKH